VVGGAAQGSAPADQGLAHAYLAARQLGVSERMHVAGRLSPMRMAEHLRSADVVVSVPWVAGFGDHVLEAMACGRPVIASATGGALDTIEHGVTGLCIPPQNPQRLTDALRLLLCDRDQREQMGHLGRRRVVEHFSLAHAVKATVDTYRSTLVRQGRRARAS
jgi:D-inositol-3-phosphate glycosyltransferase